MTRDVPRPGPRPGHRQDHLRRRQRRRRRHRFGLARPGLPGPARRRRPALQAALRLPGHRPQRPDPAQHGRQPRGQRDSTPRRTPGQLGQRDRPDLRSPERVRHHGHRRDPGRPYAFTPPVLPAAIAQHGQHPGGQRGTDVETDPAPQPPGRHADLSRTRCHRQPGSTPGSPTRRDRATATTTSSSVPGPTRGAGNPISCPTASRIPVMFSSRTNPPQVQRTTPAVPGRWGEAPWIPGQPGLRRGRPRSLNLVAYPYNNPVRAGYSFGIADLLNDAPAPQPTTTTTSSTPFRSVTPARSTTATSSTPPVV